MKKVTIIGTLVAIAGCVAAVFTFFYWLARQMASMSTDFGEYDFPF